MPRFIAVLIALRSWLAFIDGLNVVTVRIKHPGRIIARIVFGR